MRYVLFSLESCTVFWQGSSWENPVTQLFTCFVFLNLPIIHPAPKHLKVLSKQSPGKTSIQVITLLRSTIVHIQKCTRRRCPCIIAAISLKIILNKCKYCFFTWQERHSTLQRDTIFLGFPITSKWRKRRN